MKVSIITPNGLWHQGDYLGNATTVPGAVMYIGACLIETP